MHSKASREDRALLALRGVSIGDAFGQCYFGPAQIIDNLIAQRALRPAPWRYTDDTMMALSVYQSLRRYGTIDQDALAASFASHYEPSRGYGPSMYDVLSRITSGEPWVKVAQSLFRGSGSYGNGAAMRVAPVGAYFADDVDRVKLEAERSAVVTHAHPEAIAGAIAVAVAAAVATCDPGAEGDVFLETVAHHVPESEVRNGICASLALHTDMKPHQAAVILGNGTHVSCQDTVPFTLWCASRNLNHYEEALWETVSGLGDCDTNCAIVGGIVACSASADTIPVEWADATERFPLWALVDL